MERHFHEDLEEFKNKLMRMGLLVEEAIRKAAAALKSRDERLAREVIQGEEEINRLEIEVDEDGHRLLALGQPVAIDLRRIMMFLKVNNDLERMGDHAVNIAERSLKVMKEAPHEAGEQIFQMADAAKKMVRQSLDAFINEDVKLAREVLKADDEVDALNDEVYFAVKDLMERDPETVAYGIDIAMTAYNLERIADLSSNIAEDVIYIKQGKEVRHHIEDKE